jgi:hypothetical protein
VATQQSEHCFQTLAQEAKHWSICLSAQAFLSGTVTSGIVLSNAVPEVFGAGITTNAGSALAAGALVGFGTQLGSGWYVTSDRS